MGNFDDIIYQRKKAMIIYGFGCLFYLNLVLAGSLIL